MVAGWQRETAGGVEGASPGDVEEGRVPLRVAVRLVRLGAFGSPPPRIGIIVHQAGKKCIHLLEMHGIYACRQDD